MTSLQRQCKSLFAYSGNLFHMRHDCHKKNNLVVARPGILKVIPIFNTLLIERLKKMGKQL